MPNQKIIKIILLPSCAKWFIVKREKYDVYIGRPSKWGNPFSHKPGTRAEFVLPTREEAVEVYRKWIEHGAGKHLLADLHELKDKTLGCWCAPKLCHGNVLAELVAKHCF